MYPEKNREHYDHMIRMAKADGKLTDSDDVLKTNRDLLRYVMMIADKMEYLLAVRDHNNSDLLSMFKMEMAVPCLLHLELRIGENILTSICQRMMNRVSKNVIVLHSISYRCSLVMFHYIRFVNSYQNTFSLTFQHKISCIFTQVGPTIGIRQIKQMEFHIKRLLDGHRNLNVRSAYPLVSVSV